VKRKNTGRAFRHGRLAESYLIVCSRKERKIPEGGSGTSGRIAVARKDGVAAARRLGEIRMGYGRVGRFTSTSMLVAWVEPNGVRPTKSLPEIWQVGVVLTRMTLM